MNRRGKPPDRTGGKSRLASCSVSAIGLRVGWVLRISLGNAVPYAKLMSFLAGEVLSSNARYCFGAKPTWPPRTRRPLQRRAETSYLDIMLGGREPGASPSIRP